MFPALTDFPLDPIVAAHPASQRVYLRLIAVLDFTTPRDVKSWVLAEELLLKKSTVIHALSLLIERGFLLDCGRSQNNVRRLKLAWSRPDQRAQEREKPAA